MLEVLVVRLDKLGIGEPQDKDDVEFKRGWMSQPVRPGRFEPRERLRPHTMMSNSVKLGKIGHWRIVGSHGLNPKRTGGCTWWDQIKLNLEGAELEGVRIVDSECTEPRWL